MCKFKTWIADGKDLKLKSYYISARFCLKEGKIDKNLELKSIDM
jgi:hypothetical protein